MDFETSRLLKQGLPLFTALAIALLVLTLAAILHLGRDIFVPIALAVILSFVLAPAVRALQRLGLAKGVAILLTVILAVGLITALAILVGSQLASLGADIPRYQGTIRAKILALGDLAAPSGATSRALDAFEELGREFAKLGGSPDAGGAASDHRPVRVIVQESAGWLGTVGGYVSPLIHPLATGALVLIFTIFVLAARNDLRNRFIRIAGTEDIQHTTAVIDDAARRLSKLFLMQLAVNAGFGAAISAGLWIIGIPSPILWGVLAGILRFVPYIGAVFGLLPPLALAIAVDPGWTMLMWTVLLFAVVEPTLGQVVEPLLFGHSTGLSPVAVILAATVWTFLWGPIGLVLATPLTVCLVVLGRHVRSLSFIDMMLGDRPALSPPQIFYQRMLAGDPAEAILQATEFLRERALSTYYDEVALEALRLAHEDIARGRLSAERQAKLRRSTGMLIARLGAVVSDPRPRGGLVGAEAAAAVFAAGPDRGAATEVLAPADLGPGWHGPSPAICLAPPDTLDALVADMLAQVLTKHGIPARTAALDMSKALEPGTGAGIRIACLSYLEPLSTLHLRYAVRAIRRHFGGAAIVLGIWRERDPVMGRGLGRAARADAMAPTIGAALAAVVATARRDAALSVATSPLMPTATERLAGAV